MRPNRVKLASLAQKTCTLDSFQITGVTLLPKDNPFIEYIYPKLCGVYRIRRRFCEIST